MGWGIGIKANRNLSLVCDVTANQSFGNLDFQPGLLVHSDLAAVTVSYGTSANSQEINHGVSAGGSFVLGKALTWELYYNHLATFFTSLSFRL